MMVSKKKLIILILAFIILVGTPLILWISQMGKQSTQIGPRPSIATPTTFIPLTQTPQGKIVINDVVMDNFVETASRVDEANDVFFVDTSEYEIVYLTPFQQFLITIKQTPFESNRIRAEADLLRTLNISEADACKLNVQITMPGFVDEAYTGRIFPLSFCN